MKKKVLWIVIGIVIILSVLIVVFGVVHSRKFSPDVKAMAEYLWRYENPSDPTVKEYARADYGDETIYYLHCEAVDNTINIGEVVQVELLIENRGGGNEICFFADAAYGLNADVKERWDKRDTMAKSVHVFTEKEMSDIVEYALQYAQKLQEIHK